MQFIITIKDGDIAEQIGYMVEDHVTQNFDSDVVKAAGVTKKELVKASLADEKFMAKYVKAITTQLNGWVDGDLLYDAICEIDAPAVLTKAAKQCYKLQEKADNERRAQRQTDDLKAAIKTLEAAGFKVTKG